MAEEHQDNKIVSNTILQEDNKIPKKSSPNENSVKFRLYTEEISFDDFLEQKKKAKKVIN
jgi:hypothetical protein